MWWQGCCANHIMIRLMIILQILLFLAVNAANDTRSSSCQTTWNEEITSWKNCNLCKLNTGWNEKRIMINLDKTGWSSWSLITLYYPLSSYFLHVRWCELEALVITSSNLTTWNKLFAMRNQKFQLAASQMLKQQYSFVFYKTHHWT